mmetsp:Transcript_36251/g.42069  ORF Transcript_36251/g.42069 Transcript_36251/m.42069 type:complete len:319 (+) Transcript_36251:142-1098(+)
MRCRVYRRWGYCPRFPPLPKPRRACRHIHSTGRVWKRAILLVQKVVGMAVAVPLVPILRRNVKRRAPNCSDDWQPNVGSNLRTTGYRDISMNGRLTHRHRHRHIPPVPAHNFHPCFMVPVPPKNQPTNPRLETNPRRVVTRNQETRVYHVSIKPRNNNSRLPTITNYWIPANARNGERCGCIKKWKRSRRRSSRIEYARPKRVYVHVHDERRAFLYHPHGASPAVIPVAAAAAAGETRARTTADRIVPNYRSLTPNRQSARNNNAMLVMVPSEKRTRQNTTNLKRTLTLRTKRTRTRKKKTCPLSAHAMSCGKSICWN